MINGYAASGEVDIFAGASGQWRGGLLGAGDGRLGGSLGGACRMEAMAGWLGRSLAWEVTLVSQVGLIQLELTERLCVLACSACRRAKLQEDWLA